MQCAYHFQICKQWSNHRLPGITYINKCHSNSSIRQLLCHLHRCHKSQLMNDTKENMCMQILANDNHSKISHLYSNLCNFILLYSWWLVARNCACKTTQSKISCFYTWRRLKLQQGRSLGKLSWLILVPVCKVQYFFCWIMRSERLSIGYRCSTQDN